MATDTPQKLLFDRLKHKLPADLSLAESLMKWLNVSSDSAYRRIRGETPLTVDELAVLSESTGLSANELMGIGGKKQVLFEPHIAQVTANSFKKYVEGIVTHLGFLQGFSERQIIYCSKDLPIFHFFFLPELASFKHHFWMHVILQDPAFQDGHYQPAIEDADTIALLNEALDLYNAIPTIEVWNTESLNSTLFQIDFYKHSRFFGSAQEIKRQYDLLDEVVNHVEMQAEASTKFKPGANPDLLPKNYQLFFNQVSLADNTMLAITGNQKFAVVNYGVLNYLTCYDQPFCNSIDLDLQNIIRRSTKLSDGNVKQRSMFFNTLHEKVHRYRKLI